MRNLWPGVLFIAALVLGPFVSSSAAYAGAKRVHNNDVRAQCIAKADAENLTGHARHVAVKQCREEGSSFSLMRFLRNPQ
jgi:hypothetical protein